MKNKNLADKAKLNFVVGIGASAGGLDAINSFFEDMPEDSGLSFVIVQHLSPDYKSFMADLLSRHTRIHINEAADNMEIKPNNIYLIPNRSVLTVKAGKLHLSTKANSKIPNNVIDVFFESLAEEYRSSAIGIILSGTGHDGTRGAEMIKKLGGMVMVQDPSSAAFDGMPNSVLAKNLADFILPPESMAVELIDYINESSSLRNLRIDVQRDELILGEVLILIRKLTGVDFTFYKKPTLFRRVFKRIRELNLSNIKEYLNYLTSNPAEVHILSNEFLISVTSFFRDREAYEELTAKVIPAIMRFKKPGDTVKIWSVACCTGEEAYSLSILFHEYITKHQLENIHVKIFATDIDRMALETASRGIYSKSIIQHVTGQRIARYFGAEGQNYRVNQEIRKSIVFSYHNIIKDPPFSRMDLITCRNMLIYLNPESQKEVLRRLHFAINLNGYLFLGPSEHCGVLKNSLEETDKKWRLFKCVNKVVKNESYGYSPIDRKATGFHRPVIRNRNPLTRVSDLFRETMLEGYKCCGILIDRNFDLKDAIGDFRSFAELPEKGMNFNIMKLLPSDISIAIGVAARRALKENTAVSMKNINLKLDGVERMVDATVKPYASHPEYDGEFLFIVLTEHERKEEVISLSKIDPVDYDRVAELERELKETRENLQSVIEELETTNEELQSANEELVSSNEELQSTNEELQSLNEELHTVSTEHQMKIRELMELNDEMVNYFNNSDIGQIVVDRNLIIRKYSPATRKMVNLIDSDINRSISDITTRFPDLDLVTDIKVVINEMAPLEKQVCSGSNWYLMRITPYVRQDKSYDGVVVSFVDVTETKRLSAMLEGVFNSSSNGISILKPVLNERNDIIDFEYIAANKAAEMWLNQHRGTISGKRLRIAFPEKGLEQFNIFKEVYESGESRSLQYFFEARNRWFEMTATMIMGGVVVTETDVTDKKKAADLLAQNYAELKTSSGILKYENMKLEQSNMDLLQFASVASHDLKEPLRKIQTYANLLLAKARVKLEPNEFNNLSKIIVSAERMQKLIEDVLMYSRLSNVKALVEKVDLNQVLHQTLDDMEISIKEKNAMIKAHRLPVIYGVPGQLKQLFQNLIGNSLKFIGEKDPNIEISADALSDEIKKQLNINPADYFCVKVKDNGIGFDEVYKDQIFGIFQRLNGNNFTGTGIGLAICKRIMENHSGLIIAKGKPDEGAEFIMLFPVLSAQAKGGSPGSVTEISSSPQH